MRRRAIGPLAVRVVLGWKENVVDYVAAVFHERADRAPAAAVVRAQGRTHDLLAPLTDLLLELLAIDGIDRENPPDHAADGNGDEQPIDGPAQVRGAPGRILLLSRFSDRC